jgi:hypothetical protein
LELLELRTVIAPLKTMPAMHPIAVGIYDNPTIPVENLYCRPKTNVNVEKSKYIIPETTAMYNAMMLTGGNVKRTLSGRMIACLRYCGCVMVRSSSFE